MYESSLYLDKHSDIGKCTEKTIIYNVAEIASKNPVLAPFVDSLNTAKTFYTASKTQDSKTALNSRLIKYLEDAINSTSTNQEDNKIVETLHNGFVQVLSQYGLVAAPPPSPTP